MEEESKSHENTTKQQLCINSIIFLQTADSII